MKLDTQIRSLPTRKIKPARILIPIVGLLLLIVLLYPTALAAKDDAKNTSTMGSGAQYTTTVERQTEGALDAADFRQVSTLGSRITKHLNEAVADLEDENGEAARQEIEKGLSLVRIIREMLPKVTVTTVVKDSKNREVYRDTETVQDDLVPIYQEMTAVEVVQPILDAKKEAAALKGVRLADAEIIHTSVLLDLGYVERKLNVANKLALKQPAEALDELILAQTVGLRMSVRKQDSPLVAAQQALRIAERMVNEKRYEAAEDNLRVARFHLDTYSTLVGPARKKEVAELQKEVDALFGKLEKKGAESRVRDLWSRATAWFAQDTGQTHQTTTQEEENKK